MKDQLKLDGTKVGEAFKVEVVETYLSEENLDDGRIQKTTDKVESGVILMEDSVNMAVCTHFDDWKPSDEEWTKIVITIKRKD